LRSPSLPISAFGSYSSLSSSARFARSPTLAHFPSSAVSPSAISSPALQAVDPAEMSRGQRIHQGPSTQQAHSVKRPPSTFSASAPSSACPAPPPESSSAPLTSTLNAATPIFSLPLMSYPLASLFPFLPSSSTPSTDHSETIHPTLLISPLSSPTHSSDPSSTPSQTSSFVTPPLLITLLQPCPSNPSSSPLFSLSSRSSNASHLPLILSMTMKLVPLLGSSHLSKLGSCLRSWMEISSVQRRVESKS
jgi:hypothetical protein